MPVALALDLGGFVGGTVYPSSSASIPEASSVSPSAPSDSTVSPTVSPASDTFVTLGNIMAQAPTEAGIPAAGTFFSDIKLGNSLSTTSSSPEQLGLPGASTATPVSSVSSFPSSYTDYFAHFCANSQNSGTPDDQRLSSSAGLVSKLSAGFPDYT